MTRWTSKSCLRSSGGGKWLISAITGAAAAIFVAVALSLLNIYTATARLAPAETVAKVVGYDVELVFDSSKPDGTPRKLIGSSRFHELGWNNVRSLEDGIASIYEHWLESQN